MPNYNLNWSYANGPVDGVKQDDTQVIAQVTGSTPEKARSRVEAELPELGDSARERYFFSWEELDEDGDVVASGKDY